MIVLMYLFNKFYLWYDRLHKWLKIKGIKVFLTLSILWYIEKNFANFTFFSVFYEFLGWDASVCWKLCLYLTWILFPCEKCLLIWILKEIEPQTFHFNVITTDMSLRSIGVFHMFGRNWLKIRFIEHYVKMTCKTSLLNTDLTNVFVFFWYLHTLIPAFSFKAEFALMNKTVEIFFPSNFMVQQNLVQ